MLKGHLMPHSVPLVRGGPDRDPGPRYQPFRLTPYVTKIRVSDGAPAQPCCLLIAERIHSGYEGGQTWRGGGRQGGSTLGFWSEYSCYRGEGWSLV